MEWVKKHVDTVIILGGILSSVFWMNGKFTEVDHKLAEMEKDMSVIKTVLILKGILPMDLASIDDDIKKGNA